MKIHDNYFDYGNQQHIGLSPQTEYILNCDGTYFKLMFYLRQKHRKSNKDSPNNENEKKKKIQDLSLGALINHIVKNYIETADASIAHRLNEKYQEFSKMFPPSQYDRDSRNKIIKELQNREEKRLLNLKKQYTSSELKKPKKFYLKNEVKELLIHAMKNGEDKYYKRPGQYLTAIVEEYVHKPYLERERIFCADLIQEIDGCIRKKKSLNVTTSTLKHYYMFPLRIETDPMSMYHYVIGYSVPKEALPDHAAEEEKEKIFLSNKKACAFRLSNISVVEDTPLNNCTLTKTDVSELNKKVKQQGIQFLLSSPDRIRVKLSEEGVQQYNQNFHLRPQYTSIEEENIYVFDCPSDQIKFYFFKFGEKAEILDPPELRAYFQNEYQKAFMQYQ